MPENNEDIKYQIYTFDDYFTHHGITEDISSTTITGSGSETDPYMINSEYDFWYLSKYRTFSHKYLVLNCDIYLNDETFDEKGNPSGGDGVIYQITGAFNGGYNHVDGRGHAIYGFYVNDTSKGAALFGPMRSVRNLNMYNVYVNASSCSTFGSSVTTIDNCKTAGTIIAKNCANGICGNVNMISNCVNYANVSGGAASSGISGSGSGYGATEIYNCVNYGNIIGTSNEIGGICSKFYSTVENCINYGDVRGICFVGGIVGSSANGSTKYINNCKNYGNISTGAHTVGGIVGLADSIVVRNCQQYGNVTSGNSDVWYHGCGEIIGRASKNLVQISDCYVKVEKGCSIIGTIGSSNMQIDIAQVEYEFDNPGRFYAAVIACARENNLDINVRDVKIVNKSLKGVYLFNTLQNVDLDLSGVYLETNNMQNAETIIDFKNLPQNYTVNYENGIIVTNNEDGVCYGENFKHFYRSWKTGKFGICALNGTGFFQDVVSKESLLKKGFRHVA